LVFYPKGRTLIIFENRVLRGVFGPKREETIAEWIKLHTEELHKISIGPCCLHL
jgi:hypothetical protein